MFIDKKKDLHMVLLHLFLKKLSYDMEPRKIIRHVLDKKNVRKRYIDAIRRDVHILLTSVKTIKGEKLICFQLQ